MSGPSHPVPTIAPALAVSASMHLALVLALTTLPRTDYTTERSIAPPLQMVLIAPQRATPAAAPAESLPAAMATPPRQSTPAIAAAPRPVTPAQLASVAEPVPATTGAPQGDADAHVEFATSAVVARLGEALQMRSLMEFPAEVDVPVRPPGKFDVEYPAAALAERREAVVIAWVVVGTKGEVEEIIIAEGGPEFGEPVQNALLSSQFQPAMDQGVPIRYATTLEFSFRLGAPPAAITPAAR